MTTCSRSGCTKKLRKDNTKGVCSKNCESMEAPPAARAKGVAEASSIAKLKITPTQAAAGSPARAKLFQIALLLGLHPDAVIDELAQGWIDALREKLNEEA